MSNHLLVNVPVNFFLGPKVVKSEAIDVEDEDDPPVANEKSPPKTPANREGSISEEENLIIDENSGYLFI